MHRRLDFRILRMTSPGGVKQHGEGRSDPVSGSGRRAAVCKPGALRVSKTLSVDADKVAAAMSTRTRSTRTVLGTGITLEAGCADKVRGSRGLDRRHICAQACHVDRPWYLQDAAHSSSMSHALTHRNQQAQIPVALQRMAATRLQ